MTQTESAGRRSDAGLAATAEGSHAGAFAAWDWLLLALVAGVFGSSYLLIDIGLDHFKPGLIASSRVVLAAATLALVPAAWKPIERRDWSRLFVFSALWFTIPFVLLPLAQEHIESSLAGMLNGAVPIPQALIAALLLRRRLGRPQVAGILVGFGGILTLTLPSSLDTSATALGVALILLTTLSWAISGNLIVPLQQRYGAARLGFWSLLISAVLLLPYGVIDGRHSEFALGSAAAVLFLGVAATGMIQCVFSVFLGRAGPVRGGLPIYLVPIVAPILGVIVRDDSVETLAPAGLALILFSAYLLSRTEARRTRDVPEPAAAAVGSAESDGAAMPVASVRASRPPAGRSRLLIPVLALLCAGAFLWFSIRRNGRARHPSRLERLRAARRRQ